MVHAEPVVREAAARVELERFLQRGFRVREQARVQAALAEQPLGRHAQRVERHGPLQQRD